MIYKMIVVLLICAGMSGCAVPNNKYGNFLVQPAIETEQIVENAILQLTQHYPPANTELYLYSPPSTDLFGCDLVTRLRESGYKIYEHQPNDIKSKESLNFNYIIDNTKDEQGVLSFVRLTLFIENDVMTCGYDDETLLPISVWSKGEV